MRARLVIEKGEGSPRYCDLDRQRTATLGRSRDNTIILHDEHASRQHAEVFFENGQWFLRDLDTLNGTFVNGEKITAPVALQNGQMLGIADMRLSFSLVESDLLDIPGQDERPLRAVPDLTGTTLFPDELSMLLDFMTAAVKETDPGLVIQRALETVQRKTKASMCGFLSLDKEQPFSKMVYPQSAQVDALLSRQLTRRVQETGQTAWLQGRREGAIGAELNTNDSLAPFQDAVCVPLACENFSLGALHVYRVQQVLTQQEVYYCQIVAHFAGYVLLQHRRNRLLEADNSRLRRHAPWSGSDALVGSSPAMTRLRELIARAGPADCTVLIQGETGSGKELVALGLHRQSRRAGPFVPANCAALVQTLCESLLFGHRKGAFSGATTDHAGFFEQADDGTLFLDEIGEMPLDAQVKLLRAIETKRIRPVGAEHDVHTDVRVIAATNRGLEQAKEEGKFREDLYYRLRVIAIQVPPLREHAEDIPELADHFLRKWPGASGEPKRLSPAALKRLQEHPWPGNVRQFLHVLQGAVVMGSGDTIEPAELSLPDTAASRSLPSLRLQDVEACTIRQALERCSGAMAKAAELLGINRDTLRRKIKEYNLSGEE
jgi:Nif-specific regulatory protein